MTTYYKWLKDGREATHRKGFIWPKIGKWLEVEGELIAGRAVPGYKLVEGRRGARAWSDETADSSGNSTTMELNRSLRHWPSRSSHYLTNPATD